MSLLKSKERAIKGTQEQDDIFTDVANHIHGDMLIEILACVTSAFGSHRVILDQWKRTTAAQKSTTSN